MEVLFYLAYDGAQMDRAWSRCFGRFRTSPMCTQGPAFREVNIEIESVFAKVTGDKGVLPMLASQDITLALYSDGKK